MCGRARCTLGGEAIVQATGVPSERWKDMERYKPSYNVSPGAYTPVMVPDDATGGVNIQAMKWGLIPSFTNKLAKPDHYRMMNARSEDLQERPAYRRLLARRRCIVILNGFYEWHKEGSVKQPYYITFERKEGKMDEGMSSGKKGEAEDDVMSSGKGETEDKEKSRKGGEKEDEERSRKGGGKEDEVMYLAALFDSWEQEDGTLLWSYSILTTGVPRRLEWLHNRMPVLLHSPANRSAWMDQNAKDFRDLYVPFSEPELNLWSVSPKMNKPAFDSPECCRLVPRVVQKDAGDISALFRKRPEIKPELKPELKPEIKPFVGEFTPSKREIKPSEGQLTSESSANFTEPDQSDSSYLPDQSEGDEALAQRLQAELDKEYLLDKNINKIDNKKDNKANKGEDSKKAAAAKNNKRKSATGGGGRGSKGSPDSAKQKSLLSFFAKPPS